MKKLLLPLFLFLFLIPIQSRSSHIVGGEITWECSPIGKYRFFVKLYRDCSGIPFSYGNYQLNITGNPLPRNRFNTAFNFINIIPDSVGWAANNYGDISPECSSGGSPYNCSNGDLGAFQEFRYKSGYIDLNGTPPPSGWKIYLTTPCCRPGTENLNTTTTSNQFILSSIMYGNGNPMDSCYDNAPRFTQSPDYIFCRGILGNGQYTVVDPDGDSLYYRLDSTFDTPYTNPSYVNYYSPYSFDDPLPDTSLNSLNQSLSINHRNGWFEFMTNNSTGTKKYWVGVQVDSYRNGIKLSSVHRELPILVADCPLLNLNPQEVNVSPTAQLPFGSGSIPDTTVVAGTILDFPIVINDPQLVNGVQAQEQTRRYYGERLSLNITDSTFCRGADTSCATFEDSVYFNSYQSIYESKKIGLDTVRFRWRTECHDLSSSGNARTHYFTIRLKDDFCPVPAISYQVFSVTVMPNPPLCGAVTGVSEVKQNSELSIYPNPSEGRVNIDKSASTSLMIQIFDIRGKLVKEEILFQEQNSLLLPENSGVYILRITDGSGTVNHYKVIKN